MGATSIVPSADDAMDCQFITVALAVHVTPASTDV
jgi:hypothetical protein